MRALLLGLHAPLLFGLARRRCSASARWRSARCGRARGRPRPGALVVQPPLLSSSRRRCSSVMRRCFFRLPPSRLVLALLTGLQVAPELFVLPPPRVPVALVLARAPFSLAPLLIVEAAELSGIQRSRRGCTR